MFELIAIDEFGNDEVIEWADDSEDLIDRVKHLESHSHSHRLIVVDSDNNKIYEYIPSRKYKTSFSE